MNVMLFDVSRDAHLPTFLRYLIEYWNARDFTGTCFLVVSRSFVHEHADVVQLADCAPRRNVQFVALTRDQDDRKREVEEAAAGAPPTFADLLRTDAPLYAGHYDWELFCHYTEKLNAGRAFIIHLDHYLPLLATHVQVPIPISGIYFGPTFHYSSFEDPGTSAQLEPVRTMREKFVLARALREPKLERLFFLDPYAVEPARKFPGGSKVALLPDPVRAVPASPQDVDALRAELGIEPGRKIFLLFGELTARKGIRELFDALGQLPPDVARRICVVLAGRAAPKRQTELQNQSAALRARLPAQIIERCSYIPHAQVAAYFQLADVVLAPYPRHNGMSGILLLAAAYQKPVLSSAYGLMGEMTRRHRLGLAVDVTQPSHLAGALTRFVEEDARTFCDFEQMNILAGEHSPERFASEIFQSLG